MSKVLGPEWTSEKLVKNYFKLKEGQNYIQRITLLLAMAAFSESLPSDVVRETFIPIMVVLSKDPVPNVRFNVAKTAYQIKKHHKKVVDVSEITNALKADKDDDVKYFTKQAMALRV